MSGGRTVGEVAAMAGVTVRTLHHYDRIGLLSPSGRSAAGYRLYAPDDLDRLHQVLLYRELGFSLEDVAALLADDADPEAHLRRQHRLLRDRLDRTQQMVAAVEKEMEARAMGISLTPEERFEVFGEFDPDQYEEEVQERWGETDAYAQSKRRTSAYTKDDWVRIKAEGEDVEARFAAALAAGVPGGLRAGHGHRRGAPAADQPELLRLPAGDARRPRPDVRRGRAVHGALRAAGARAGAVREHRRPGQRPPADGARPTLDVRWPRPVRAHLPASTGSGSRRARHAAHPSVGAATARLHADEQLAVQHAEPAVVGGGPAQPGVGDGLQLRRRRQPVRHRLLGERRRRRAAGPRASPTTRARPASAKHHELVDGVTSRSPAACAQASSRRPASGSPPLRRATAE